MLSPTRGSRQAVTAALQANLSPFLNQVGALEQLPLAPIRSWLRVADYATVPEEQTPACYVTSGTATTTSAVYDAGGLDMWVDVTLRVVMVVAGRDRAETEDRAALYCDAARYCLQADSTLAGQVKNLQVTGWAPAGSTADATAVYRAVHDLTAVCLAPTTRNLPTAWPTATDIHLLPIDRLEP